MISPILSLDPPNFNIAENSVSDNLNLHEAVTFRSPEEIRDVHGTNGPIGSNGFVVSSYFSFTVNIYIDKSLSKILFQNFSENLNTLPNLSANAKLLSNHVHTVDIINSFANGNNLDSPEIDRFDYNIEEKRYI